MSHEKLQADRLDAHIRKYDIYSVDHTTTAQTAVPRDIDIVFPLSLDSAPTTLFPVPEEKVDEVLSESEQPATRREKGRIMSKAAVLFLATANVTAPMAPADRLPQIEQTEPGIVYSDHIWDYQPKAPVDIAMYYGITDGNIQPTDSISSPGNIFNSVGAFFSKGQDAAGEIPYDIGQGFPEEGLYVKGAPSSPIILLNRPLPRLTKSGEIFLEQLKELSDMHIKVIAITLDGSARKKFIREAEELMHDPRNPNPLIRLTGIYEKEGPYPQISGGKDPTREYIDDDLGSEQMQEIMNDPVWWHDSENRPYIMPYSDFDDKQDTLIKWHQVARDLGLHVINEDYQFSNSPEFVDEIASAMPWLTRGEVNEFLQNPDLTNWIPDLKFQFWGFPIPGVVVDVRNMLRAITSPYYDEASFYAYKPQYLQFLTKTSYSVSFGYGEKPGDWRIRVNDPSEGERAIINAVESDAEYREYYYNERVENSGPNKAEKRLMSIYLPPFPRIVDSKEAGGKTPVKSIQVFPSKP